MRAMMRFLTIWFADSIWRRRAEVAEQDLRDARTRIAQQDSRLALLESEVEFLTQWREREVSRLDAEIAILRAKRVLATDTPAASQDES